MLMKSFLKFISHNKLYTSIEVVGMAVAIACVIFIGNFVIDDYQTDRAIKEEGRTYVSESEGYLCMTYPIKDILRDKYPEITDMCRIMSTKSLNGVNMKLKVNGDSTQQNAIVTDDNFFKFFPAELTAGDKDKVLKGHSILLSQSAARKYFKEDAPIGKTVTLDVNGSKMDVSVTGVFEDFRNTILPQPEIIYNLECIKQLYPNLVHPGNSTVSTFFKLTDNADVEVLQSKILNTLMKEEYLFSNGFSKDFSLVKYNDIPKCDNIQVWDPFQNIIDPDFVNVFIAIGILLLIFSIMNYVSLTVAQSGFRAKEMATRRLLGSSNVGIILRYLGEALMLTLLSSVIAIILVSWLSPYLNLLVGKDISPFADGVWQLELVFVILIVIILAFFSGIIPALLVSRYKPIDIVRGVFGRTSKMRLGRILITIQALVAFVTITMAIVMQMQLKHMISKPMGYERDNIISVKTPSYSDLYIDELKQLPCVEKIGFVLNVPMSTGATTATFNIDGEKYMVELYYGDNAAFDILGFKPFTKLSEPTTNSLWLTESASRLIKFDSNAPMTDFNICGVFEDFKKGGVNNLNDSREPIIYYVVENEGGRNFSTVRTMIVKVKGDENEALAQLKQFYDKHESSTGAERNVRTFNEQNQSMYGKESRNLVLLSVFCLIIMLLTALAMIAMSTYYVRQHTKETAIRKILGCDRMQLFVSTSSKFLKLILIAIIIGIPISWYIVERWLLGYSYRIDNDIVPYLMSALIISVVAIFSISWQLIRLINTQPVNSLKKE